MKTANEWRENWPVSGSTPPTEVIEQIQRDALQLAADIAGDPANENWNGGSTGNARGTSKQIKSAILAAMPNDRS
jgi:hypothetical protein